MKASASRRFESGWANESGYGTGGCLGRAELFRSASINLDIKVFGYSESIISLNAEIAHRALNLFVLDRICTARRLQVRGK
jgi:hypothetical protein